MQRAGIAVREHDVERDPAARARSRQLNPRGSVPTIDVDGAVLVGWSEPRFEAMLVDAKARKAR
jgi:glutathione S-transferase